MPTTVTNTQIDASHEIGRLLDTLVRDDAPSTLVELVQTWARQIENGEPLAASLDSVHPLTALGIIGPLTDYPVTAAALVEYQHVAAHRNDRVVFAEWVEALGEAEAALRRMIFADDDRRDAVVIAHAATARALTAAVALRGLS